ncbi:MAG TPA: DMT family transporter [Streptosporangiaceae bacterium]|jgi:drug/metabolite transporter (DMT)-like permease
MRQEQHARIGLLVAAFSALTFSTSGALGTSLIDAGWSPTAAVATRITIAALVLAGPAAWSLRGRWHTLRREAGQVIGYGLFAVAGCQLFYFYALQRLPVGVALMLEYQGIVFVVLWMWLRHGHRPHPLTLAGSAAALAGLVLVLGVLGNAHLNLIGALYGLGAAACLAAYFVLGSHISSDLPPIALASTGMGVGAITLLALGGAGVLPMHVRLAPVNFAGHHVSWLVPVAGLSLVAAVLAYVAGIAAARMLGAKLASFVGLAEVVFAIGIAWLLLGQLPTAVQLGGGALIVAGIALVRLDELRTPAAVHTPPGIDPPLVTNPPTASSAPLLTATRPPQDQLG